MVVLTRGEKIGLRDVPGELRDGGSARKPSGTLSGAVSMQEAEKRMIQQALQDHDGNRTLAAKQLGISRRTLHRKLNDYDLH
jgi:transcriptional regulator of acetoin/glycerol metabolism